MPQSLSAVYIHLVFSTKDRRPFLRDKSTRDALHSFLGAVSKELDCPPILVGGVEDHVHIIARLGRTITQAEWVKELKRVSNRWLKERSREFADFEWQGGYAAFSVSQSNLEPVKSYIAGQEEHHRKISFQDELRVLFRKRQPKVGAMRQPWARDTIPLGLGCSKAAARAPSVELSAGGGSRRCRRRLEIETGAGSQRRH
jgi:putative transposase